jgi:hypothetical protein
LIDRIDQDGTAIDKAATTPDQTILIITDGGVHDHKSTFGAVITNGTHLMATNMGTLYIMENFESSHRSELCGVLAGITILNLVLQKRQQELSYSTKIEIYL